jgi:hypothetical protein
MLDDAIEGFAGYLVEHEIEARLPSWFLSCISQLAQALREQDRVRAQLVEAPFEQNRFFTSAASAYPAL